MTATRKHVCQIDLEAPPDKVFTLLLTPSAIREWWQASTAIVDARVDGTWTASWGEEDKPDYISSFRIKALEPPTRILLGDSTYYARTEPLPFQAHFTTEFLVRPSEKGCILQVTQDGFPADAIADDFYKGCEIGWRNTFEGISSYLEKRKK